jgi:hypothetical protein
VLTGAPIPDLLPFLYATSHQQKERDEGEDRRREHHQLRASQQSAAQWRSTAAGEQRGALHSPRTPSLKITSCSWRQQRGAVQTTIAINTFPSNRPWRSISLWDVETTTFSRQSAHRWRWGCHPYAPVGRPFPPRKIPGTHLKWPNQTTITSVI